MTLYIGVTIGFIMGIFAGIILMAIVIAARDESERIMPRNGYQPEKDTLDRSNPPREQPWEYPVEGDKYD